MQETLTVAVHGIATSGNAVGRVVGPEESPRIGITAFVPFAAPGETVTVRVTKPKDRFLEAELVSVDVPVESRVAPPCPYFGTCGGCNLQHMDYDSQLVAKTDMVRSAFRSGKLGDDIVALVEPVVPGLPYGYRRRVTLHVAEDGSVGYRPRRSHDVLTVEDCPVSEDPIRRFLASGFSLAGLLPYESKAELVVEAHGDAVLLGSLYVQNATLSDEAINQLQSRMEKAFTGGAIRTIQHAYRARFGNAPEGGAPGYFLQGNAAVNRLMVQQVRDIATRVNAKTGYDLYAGAGNFALAMAEIGIDVIAAESEITLVIAGRTEANQRGLKEKVTFHETTVEQYLKTPRNSAHLIVADPPRAGLENLVPALPSARDLILVSCDLASAVRDVRNLIAEGWVVQSITPYDMFAQTAHIELLTHLSKAQK